MLKSGNEDIKIAGLWVENSKKSITLSHYYELTTGKFRHDSKTRYFKNLFTQYFEHRALGNFAVSSLQRNDKYFLKISLKHPLSAILESPHKQQQLYHLFYYIGNIIDLYLLDKNRSSDIVFDKELVRKYLNLLTLTQP